MARNAMTLAGTLAVLLATLAAPAGADERPWYERARDGTVRAAKATDRAVTRAAEKTDKWLDRAVDKVAAPSDSKAPKPGPGPRPGN